MHPKAAHTIFHAVLCVTMCVKLNFFVYCRAGATIVGGDELVAKVKDGFLEFDRYTLLLSRCMAHSAKILTLSARAVA
jgi:hypothetical protein